MNNQTNIPTENHKPRLKKVKKPIKKIQPQMQDTALSKQPKDMQKNVATFSNDVSSNPFQTKSVVPQQKFDPFNVNVVANSSPSAKPLSNNNDEYIPQFINDDKDYDNVYSHSTISQDKKMLILAAVIAFVIGFIFAKILGGEQKIVHNGLQEVVLNGEVPQGRARCGKAPTGQGCVLYIMNPQRQELSARDFYDLAAQLTGRQRFVIETGNMRYSNTKIRPGEIAQFNIPPLTQ